MGTTQLKLENAGVARLVIRRCAP